MVRVTVEEKVFEYDRNDKNTLALVEIAEEMVKRDISIIETKRVRDRLQEIEEETKLHYATNDELGLKYVFVECLDGEDYDDVYRQIGDFYRAALLTSEMDEEPEPSVIENLSELSLDYITEKMMTAALCGVDDETVLIDDLRPLELNDELAERVDEAIPLESLDRVDEDIKQNFFGDKDKDRKNYLTFYKEHEKQTEYDRFVSVLKSFVSNKMTNAYKKSSKDIHWSFKCHKPNLPKWQWCRPDVRIEAKRIFDLWCGEFLEYRTMPISYMWSFLKSRLIINGWTNRGLGRKEWDWHEETTKVINNEGYNRDTFDKEYPCPRFEYSKDWLNAERVEINYLKAIEDMLIERWNKQTKKSAPIVDIKEWTKLCKLIMEWRRDSNVRVAMFIEPHVHVVSEPSVVNFTCKPADISCEVPFDDVNSQITIKNNVIPVLTFSRFSSDESTKTITLWLTENINDEEYKAYEICFGEGDTDTNDMEDIAEKFTEGVSNELDEMLKK